MDGRKDTAVEALLEHLIEYGPDDIATVFGRAFELAMRIERERFLRASPYERTAERRGYASGCKPRRIDTPAGTVTVDCPKSADHDGAPFHPQPLERGRRQVARRDAGGGGDDHQGRIGKQLKSIWTADDPARAEAVLTGLVASYRNTAPKLAA